MYLYRRVFVMNFPHVQDAVNPHILHMFEDTFSLDTVHAAAYHLTVYET